MKGSGRGLFQDTSFRTEIRILSLESAERAINTKPRRSVWEANVFFKHSDASMRATYPTYLIFLDLIARRPARIIKFL
jgi:hypothetical protein